eukprot:6811051-Prymnesium_polylepis.1
MAAEMRAMMAMGTARPGTAGRDVSCAVRCAMGHERTRAPCDLCSHPLHSAAMSRARSLPHSASCSSSSSSQRSE